MANRFTERSQRVILLAQEESRRLQHDYVGTEHVLLGLIALGEGLGWEILIGLSVDPRRLRSLVETKAGTGGKTILLGETPFTPGAKRVLEFAVEEAQTMGSLYVGTEHLLIGMIREDAGLAAQTLKELGLLPEIAREEALNFKQLTGNVAIPEPVRREPPPKLNPNLFAEAQLQTIALRDEVTAVVITRKPHPQQRGRTIVLVVLKAFVDLDEFYGTLTGLLTEKAMSLLEFKAVGSRPVKKMGKRWVEDTSFDYKLIF